MIYKFIFLILVFSGPIFAQTGQRIMDLLEVSELSWADAASFVLEASDHGTFSNTEAFSYAMERGWLPGAAAEDNAQLGGIALLLMQSFDHRGGIMYSMFRTPRYAYRELVHKNIIMGRTWPSMTVSGETLIYMISRFLAIRETEEQEI